MTSRRSRTSLHEHLEDDEELPEPSGRSFGVVFATLFATIGLWPLWEGRPPRVALLIAAASLAGVALFIPRALGPLSRLWQRVGLLLHRFISPIIIATLFYAAVTPFGLMMRLFGRGLRARLRPDPQASSYWVSRRGTPPSKMTNQF